MVAIFQVIWPTAESQQTVDQRDCIQEESNPSKSPFPDDASVQPEADGPTIRAAVARALAKEANQLEMLKGESQIFLTLRVQGGVKNGKTNQTMMAVGKAFDEEIFLGEAREDGLAPKESSSYVNAELSVKLPYDTRAMGPVNSCSKLSLSLSTMFIFLLPSPFDVAVASKA